MEDPIETYKEEAYQHVKNRIINLDLKPGEYITDMQIAQELDCSRTPVREAFHRLENEGLLTYRARRGWRVYALSLQDIHEVFDLKMAIEGMVAHKAAQSQDQKMDARLQSALKGMRKAAAADNVESWLEADVKLHELIFAMANNKRAYRMVSNLNDQWHRLRIGFVALQGRMKQSVAEHKVVVESILAGDGERSEREMRNHLNQVREDLVRLLSNMVFPFAQDGV